MEKQIGGESWRRKRDADWPAEENGGGAANGLLLGMGVLAVVCLALGGYLQGIEWEQLVAAGSCLAAGIGFVAIGLLELEWLERVIGFTDGLFSGLGKLFYTSWYDTLSESELLGRRGARVVWLVIGFPVFVVGCLLALRVIEW